MTPRPGKTASRAVDSQSGILPAGGTRAGRAALWFSWIFGLAMLAAVIVAVLRFSEWREFARIAEKAQPGWLVAAVILQAGTYLAQAETWRVVTSASGVSVPLSVAYQLSLAKLFVDQVLPSAGISGTAIVIRALEQRGISRTVVMSAVVVATVSYYAAYLVTLGLALLVTVVKGHASALILAAASAFVLFSAVMTATVLLLSGRRRAGPRWLTRVPFLKDILALLQEADPRLTRSARLISRSSLFQVAIDLLDAASVWVLIYSLGFVASPTGVFASFIISNLLRTIGIVPGGLGTFEAASVVTLKLAGVPIAVALSATLLFRVLSFWLPMLPGLAFSRSRNTPVRGR